MYVVTSILRKLQSMYKASATRSNFDVINFSVLPSEEIV